MNVFLLLRWLSSSAFKRKYFIPPSSPLSHVSKIKSVSFLVSKGLIFSLQMALVCELYAHTHTHTYSHTHTHIHSLSLKQEEGSVEGGPGKFYSNSVVQFKGDCKGAHPLLEPSSTRKEKVFWCISLIFLARKLMMPRCCRKKDYQIPMIQSMGFSLSCFFSYDLSCSPECTYSSVDPEPNN